MIVTFTTVSCSMQTISIEPLIEFNEIDTLMDNGKVMLIKTDNFVIKNYKDDGVNQKYIDSFVWKHKAVDIKRYNQYNIVLYKYSDRSELSKITRNSKKRILPPQQDMLLNYLWFDGKFVDKTKFENGQPIIENNKVSVSDLK